MARKKETCSQIAGKRLKMARFDVFGLTQNDLVEGNSSLADSKRGIAEKWISVFGKQQAARTLSRWENQGIPESRISDVAFCFNAEPEFFTDSGITEEHFCQLIRKANNGNAFLQRPEKNMLEMAAELGITRAALNNFFRILEIRNIPPEELDAALRKFAGEYREMLARLEKFHSDDPQIMALKTKAKAQLDSGCFDKADVYLEKAVIRDRETAMQMQETLHRRMLSAAQTTGERGDLEHARLNYRKAAVHYQNAAELVPAGEQGEIICAEYRTKQGMAHRMAGTIAVRRFRWKQQSEFWKSTVTNAGINWSGQCRKADGTANVPVIMKPAKCCLKKHCNCAKQMLNLMMAEWHPCSRIWD